MDTGSRVLAKTLEQLAAARRDEVVRLQRDQADRLADIEARGQARLADLKRRFPREIVSVFDMLEHTHDEAAQATKSRLERAKAALARTSPAPEDEKTVVHPGLVVGQLIAPSS